MADDTNTDGQQGVTFDPDAPEIKTLIDKAIKEATAGLEKNRDDLKAEKKKLAEQVKLLDGLGGEEGVKKLREFQERLAKDEEGRLIAEGKLDEVLNRRTKALMDRAAKREESLSSDLDAARKQASEFQVRFRNSTLDNTVAHKVTGLQDGALNYVQNIAKQLLRVTDEGKIEPRDEAPIWKEGKPVSVDTLRDYLLETSSFLFKPSAGGAATPTANTNGGGTRKMPRQQFEQLGHQDRAKFVRSGGQVVD